MADDVRKACEEFHRHAVAVLGQTDGCCHLVSRLLGYELATAHPVALAIGQWQGLHHAWLHVGALRLDPTADQYGQPLVASLGTGAYEACACVELVAAEREEWVKDECARITAAPAPVWGSAARDELVMQMLLA